MIVKNEAHVIERALDSALGICDAFVILDTGSTDKTHGVALDWADKHEARMTIGCTKWSGFGAARSEVLQMSRERYPLAYSVMLDADDVLSGAIDVEQLTADAYSIPVEYGDLRFRRVQVFANDRDWSYAGVLHEFPACVGPCTILSLDLLTYRCVGGGARHTNPNKYRDDALLLENALAKEPDESRRRRYQFYLGQSYRDAGMPLMAKQAYLARADMGGFAEEVYLSLFEAARAADRCAHADVIPLYRRANNYRPQRAEAACACAAYALAVGDLDVAWQAAKTAAACPWPSADVLFVDASVYYWRARDVLARVARARGDKALAKELWAELLAGPSVPGDQRAGMQLEHDTVL